MLTLESSHVVGLPAQLYTVQEVKEIIFSNDNYGVTSYKLRKKTHEASRLHLSPTVRTGHYSSQKKDGLGSGIKP